MLLISTVAFAASQQTSSTTAASIINRAEIFLDDTNNDVWTAAELLQWLNDGQRDIVLRTHCLEATEEVSLVANTIEYAISSTYSKVRAAIYVDASSPPMYKALRRGSPYNIGNLPEDWNEAAEDVPVFWYDWGGMIGIYPFLASVTTETVKLYLVTRPTDITSTDNITIPAIYDTALVYYIVAQARLRDLSPGTHNYLMSTYITELERIKQDLTDFQQ